MTMDKKTFPTKLQTIRRNGRTWLVLAIHERERLNSFSLDCLAEDGERRDFTTGAKSVQALPSVDVLIQVPEKPARKRRRAAAAESSCGCMDSACETCYPPKPAIPPCAAAMGCLCAGHARGDSPDLPCNTDETQGTPLG